jgi:fructokinase
MSGDASLRSGDASTGSGAESPAFIVIGEAIVDLIPATDEGSYVARPGGGPLNIAVGLARLGQPAAFAGRLSADPPGTVLRRHLDRSGVDCRYLRVAPQPSTISLADLVAGVAAYEFSAGGPDFLWSAAELEFLPAGARVVHFGSLASWLPPGDAAIDAAMDRIRAGGAVLVSYDPNVRPALQPDQDAARTQVERAVGHAHLVKASVEDLQWLYGRADPATVAQRWFGLGAGLVVITAGPDGASGWTRAGLAVTRPAYPAAMVDTVGAGDAFLSGLLDALDRGGLLDPAAVLAGLDADALGSALDQAGLVAGLTCERPGANPPWRSEIAAARAR